MKLKFKGKPLSLNHNMAQVIAEWCKGRPNGEVYSREELSKALNRQPSHLKEFRNHPDVVPYRTTAAYDGCRRTFYGNAATIKELRKQLGGNNADKD